MESKAKLRELEKNMDIWTRRVKLQEIFIKVLRGKLKIVLPPDLRLTHNK